MTNKDHNLEWSDDELLSAYVDGELADQERAIVEERLRSDPEARQLVEELQELSSTLQSLPHETVGHDLRAVVLQQGQHTLPSDFRTPRRWVWAVAAIAAALALAIYMPDVNNQGGNKVVDNNNQKIREIEEELEVPATPATESPQIQAPGSSRDEGVVAEGSLAASKVAEEAEFAAEVEAANDELAMDTLADPKAPMSDNELRIERKVAGRNTIASEPEASSSFTKGARKDEARREMARALRTPGATLDEANQLNHPAEAQAIDNATEGKRFGMMNTETMPKSRARPADLQIHVFSKREKFTKLLAEQGLAFKTGAKQKKQDSQDIAADVAEQLVVVAPPEKIEQLLAACAADKKSFRSLRVEGNFRGKQFKYLQQYELQPKLFAAEDDLEASQINSDRMLDGAITSGRSDKSKQQEKSDKLESDADQIAATASGEAFSDAAALPRGNLPSMAAEAGAPLPNITLSNPGKVIQPIRVIFFLKEAPAQQQ